MKRLCIVCEGKTEREFVRDCLSDHLFKKNLSVKSIDMGGNVKILRVVNHIRDAYRSFDYITTLVDFYGFKDANGRNKTQLEIDIMAGLKIAISGLDSRRIIPYIQMYEFEGLLFTDIEEFKWIIDGWTPKARKALLDIRNEFNSPEDINNSENTAPSKRLKKIFPDYDDIKAEYGPIIASEIGLPKIRQECPLFSAWVARLESLGQD